MSFVLFMSWNIDLVPDIVQTIYFNVGGINTQRKLKKENNKNHVVYSNFLFICENMYIYAIWAKLFES